MSKDNRDIVEIVDEALSESRSAWGKLASDIVYRRLELRLLRDILVEMRKLNRSTPPEGQ